MGTPISGKSGKALVGATPIAEVTDWSFDKESKTTRWVSSDTGGFERTLAGAKTGSGSISFKFNIAAASPALEGVAVTLNLYLDATHFYGVPAVIKNFKVKTDLSGVVTGGSCDFECDGAWTEPTLP